MLHGMRYRGISELVSASLLALIVVIIGGIILAKMLGELNARINQISESLIEAEISLSQAVDIAIAYIDRDGNLQLVVATGDFPVKLHGLYVNSTPASSCTVSLTTGETGALEGFDIPAYSLARITCSLGPGAVAADVKLIYEGGEVHAYAQRI